MLPDLRPDNIDLEADYFWDGRWFFGLLAGAAAVSILKDVALEGELPDTPNLAFHMLLVGSCIGAIASCSRSFHGILAPASLILFVGYIALLFARL